MINDYRLFSRRLLSLISLAFLPCIPANGQAQSIQFQDVTNAAGITPNDPNGFGHGSSFGDFNNDGRPDIYMLSYATANFLFHNNGGTFTDIAASAGVQFPTQSDRGMAAADYDNDGDLDLYIAAGYTGNVLYRNNGNNTFSDVTSSAGVSLFGQGQGVAWGDYNGDGLLDLFVTQTDGNNVLFRQESDHHFTDVTSSAGIGGFSLSLQPVFFDVDGDGDADLFVAGKENQANLLCINNGNGTFTERAQSWGIDSPAAHSQGAAVGDYDRDGDLDIYVCDFDGYNLLFRNDGSAVAEFTEVAASAGVRSGFSGNRGALLADFNDDGWLDIYVTRSNDNKMYQNNGDGTFSDVSSASGTADANSGYSPSMADYDDDGDLDIFFSNTGQNSVLLQNDGPFHNWLQIKLVGNASNRDGIGAKLTVWLSGQRQTQTIISGQAYLCTGSDLTAHFALESSAVLDSLIIQWPSGTRDRFFNLAANQKLTLEEGSGEDGGPDTTPPIISNVAAGGLTSTSATISWQTGEAADSQVEYGLATSYGSSSSLNASLVTSHTATLSSLQANTTYHYRVKSKDAAGNLATSGDFTFTTLVQPSTIFADDFNTGTLDAAKWRKGTNTSNLAAVANNALELRASGNVSGWIITTNTYAALNTTASVKVVTPNDDGDLGMSPTYNLSSPYGIFDQANWYRFYTYRNGHSGTYRLYVQWKKGGVDNGLDVTGNLVINGTVYLRLRFDSTNIHFEASLDGVSWVDTYSELFGLPGYTLNSPFYYELAGYNTGSNGVLTVDDFAINGNSAPDTQPPVISNVAASNITASAATITWTTDEASDTQVEYGLTTSYGSSSSLNAALVTSHTVSLSSLQANTTYHYRVKSKDAAGNLATSDDFTFTTLQGDVTPPVISNVAAGNITASAATITWTTNETSDSQVEYGLTTSYGSSSTLNTSLVTSHTVALSSLQANTTYHYRVKSKDAAGNLATGNDQTFRTSTSVLAFTDITLSAGTGGSTDPNLTGGHAAIFADVDGDDRPDLYITMYNVPETPTADLFFRNVDGSVFMEEAALRGIDDFDGGSHGACFADLDNDGDYDLYNGTTRGAPGILGINNIYRNNGSGFFDDVSANSGMPIREWETRSVIAFDLEGDGDLDLFGVTDYLGTDDLPDDRNQVYRNDGNLRFTAIDTGALFLARAGQGAIDTDFDGDGDVDVIAANRTGPVNLLRNEGQGFFTQVTTTSIGIAHNAGDGITTADIDNDGDLDMLLASDNEGHIYRNDGGTFSFVQSFATTDGYMGGFADLDNDGDVDLVFAGDEICYLNNGSGVFSAGPAIPVTGISDPRAVGFADIDDDGDLDFAIGCKKSRNWLLRNDFDAGNWLKVRLISPQGQAGAYGAKTRLYPPNQAGGALVGMRESRSNNGYLGQDSPVLHFGLGALAAADVVVTFLDGTTVTLSNVTANQTVTIDGVPADHEAPVISNVAAPGISATAASISWTTNEISDSQVEYGLDTNYGSMTPLDPVPVTSHAVTLANLQANTAYHYRVKSKDAAGNLATSGDFTFTTLVQPSAIFTDDFNTGTLDAAKWRKGTNTGNLAAVANNALELRSSGSVSGWIITANTYAALNTTVNVKVATPNDDGDLGMSPTYNLSSSFGIYDQANWYRFYTYRNGHSGTYRLYVQWKKGGVDSGLDVTGSLVINGTVYLRLRFDSTNIHFEASLDGVSWVDTYSELFGLPGYTLNSPFYYELAGYNTGSNGVLTVDDFAINGNSAPDTQPPVISNVAASNITTSAATITWTTNETSDTQVEYGLTTSYGSSSTLNTSLVTSHTVSLSSLQANTTYHYRVKSKDAAGNLAVSEDATFVTLLTGSAANVAFANVEDIFANNCARCHQGTTAPAGLVLLPGQAYANIVNMSSTEYPQWQRVQPGNRATSWLFEKITNAFPPVGSKMGSLTADEIALIGTWIDQGATATPVPPYADLEFRTTALLNGEINISYYANLVVWGGLPPYQFSLAGGTLPPGIALDAAGGIYGSPSTPGQYSFTIRASDSQTPAASFEQAYSLEVFNTQDHWQLPSGFLIENVLSGLHLPVNIAFVPNPGPNPNDPYFYVTLLYGDIVMVQRDFQKQTYATSLLNFAPTGEFPGSGEMGVTGITVEPLSGDVFAAMAYDEGGFKFNRVVRFQSTDGGHTAATQTVILSGIPAGISHQIQALTIGPDGKLYVNVGDGWVAEAAPDLGDLRGKILRINLDGSIPPDNPFANSQVYASGVRNPFGAAWRAADGKLYISDNGPEDNDRIAQILPGQNYGWNLTSPDLTQGAIFLWNPTVAPVAIDFMDETSFPSVYHGQLFAGLSGPTYQQGYSLLGKKIQRFGLDDGGNVVSDSLFLDYVGAGQATVIGVASGPDGLYFTDLYGENGFDALGQTQGNVYRIRWAAGDVAPPIISNVQATNVTGAGATIVWQTDEPATRQIEYGLTSDYGQATPYETNFATSHSVTLTQLAPETTYHFHVWNWDAVNNGAVSSDFTFTTMAIDSIPPVISAVRVDSISANGALVQWNTNEPATSMVDFGATADYGLSASTEELVTSHYIWLAGLTDTTLYHFRVRSSDASNNETIANDGTFTTLLNRTLLADDFNGAVLNTLLWQWGANAGNVSAVANNALELRSQGAASGWVITRNGYAARNTIASVKVVQPSDDGDLGVSPTYNLSSSYGIYDQANWYRFYIYRSGGLGSYRLFVQWKRNGVANEADVTGNLVINGAVYLRLRFDDTNIHFDASLDGVTWTETYTEVFDLPGYTLDSAFFYELSAYNTNARGVLVVDDFSITKNTASGFVAKPNEPASDPAPMPTAFILQNYPNPFNAATQISLALPHNAEVHLSVYDLAGREVKELLTGSRVAGNYEITWDGRNREGSVSSSGVYLLCLRYRAGAGSAWSQLVRRVLMVK